MKRPPSRAALLYLAYIYFAHQVGVFTYKEAAMLYIKRNAQGEIVMLSKEPSPECKDTIKEDSPEVFAFLATQTGQSAQFVASDLAFVRVMEDILEVLLEKGVISFTDLPPAAQSKVLGRKSLRKGGEASLISDDGGLI